MLSEMTIKTASWWFIDLFWQHALHCHSVIHSVHFFSLSQRQKYDMGVIAELPVSLIKLYMQIQLFSINWFKWNYFQFWHFANPLQWIGYCIIAAKPMLALDNNMSNVLIFYSCGLFMVCKIVQKNISSEGLKCIFVMHWRFKSFERPLACSYFFSNIWSLKTWIYYFHDFTKGVFLTKKR